MQRNNLLSAAKVLLIVVIGLVLAKNYFTKNATPPTIIPNNSAVAESTAPVPPPVSNNDANNGSTIPKKVFEVLAYIRANHHAMDGYVGGRIFTNYENVVPQQDANGNRISYQEWDVNPKIQGVNRGTERILTGSDGRAWYTNDHYRTFTEIRQP